MQAQRHHIEILHLVGIKHPIRSFLIAIDSYRDAGFGRERSAILLAEYLGYDSVATQLKQRFGIK